MGEQLDHDSSALPPNPPDSGGARRDQFDERRDRPRNSWIIGLVLIVLGGIFLLQNLDVRWVDLQNWWALFILIPAFAALGNAWRAYQDAGGILTRQARGSLIGGTILTLIALIFLFNLSWSLFGPVIIILIGLGLLLNSSRPG